MLVFLVIRPFIPALLTSIVLSYIFYPLYKWFEKKFKHKGIAALLVSFIVILAFILPLFLLLNAASREAYILYLTSKQKISEVGTFIETCNPDNNSICTFVSYTGKFLSDPRVKYHLQDNLEKATSYVIDSISNLIFSIPRFLLNLFIVVFTMFYLFKDGSAAFDNLKRLLPLRDIYKRHLFEKFGKVTFAIVYGYIIVAIIQGILGALGFFIFGVGSPLLWGIIITFAALIPFVGTGIVWIPAALIKLFNGILTGNTGETIGGILFILYGIIIISSIDNILRPKIIGDRAKVHPVLILVGVFGGFYLFGVIGVVMGPLSLALFVTFMEAYEKEKR